MELISLEKLAYNVKTQTKGLSGSLIHPVIQKPVVFLSSWFRQLKEFSNICLKIGSSHSTPRLFLISKLDYITRRKLQSKGFDVPIKGK